jgi:putative DNA methylase
MAIVAEGKNGRLYFSPDENHVKTALVPKPQDFPDAALPHNPRDFKTPNYGLCNFSDLFTNRQLTALTTFSDLVKEAQAQATAEAVTAGMPDDNAPPADGGTGAMAYGQAVGVYLAFAVDKLTDALSSIVSWNINRDGLRNTFARQAIPMTWDFAEVNPFSNSTGCFDNCVEWIEKCVFALPAASRGFVCQADAQSNNNQRDIMISTDPPYYDNIGYADLADFFYIWLRRSLKDTHTEIFQTMLVPKTEELVATPYRFGGSREKARNFFEDGMLQAFRQICLYARKDLPITIYYAFKQNDSEDDESGGGGTQTASTGWETMLSAIIQAGFSITGTWPMRTERTGRTLDIGTNALASSIVLVCRKRPANAPITTRRDFINALKRELKPALAELQRANIAPVDLAQSAIGPGMGVYSRFSKVLEADGSPMSVRAALHCINQELDLHFAEQDGALDADSRFCLDLYTQYAFNDMKFGEADVLARAKNTSVERLAGRGVLCAQKGVVRLKERGALPAVSGKQASGQCLWLVTQQLAQAMENGGVVACAGIAAEFPAETERAKDLAYRLFTLAERKNWAAEAYAYNSLVIAWPEIQAKVAELRNQQAKMVQGTLQ